jgi:hypothetical protein
VVVRVDPLEGLRIGEDEEERSQRERRQRDEPEGGRGRAKAARQAAKDARSAEALRADRSRDRERGQELLEVVQEVVSARRHADEARDEAAREEPHLSASPRASERREPDRRRDPDRHLRAAQRGERRHERARTQLPRQRARVREVVGEDLEDHRMQPVVREEMERDRDPDDGNAEEQPCGEGGRAAQPSSARRERGPRRDQHKQLDGGHLLERHRHAGEHAAQHAPPRADATLRGHRPEERDLRQHQREQHEQLGVGRRALHRGIREEQREGSGGDGRPALAREASRQAPERDGRRRRERRGDEMDRRNGLQRQGQRQPIDPEDRRGLLVDPVAIRKLAMLEAPGDVCVLTLVALERQVEQRQARGCDEADQGDADAEGPRRVSTVGRAYCRYPSARSASRVCSSTSRFAEAPLAAGCARKAATRVSSGRSASSIGR